MKIHTLLVASSAATVGLCAGWIICAAIIIQAPATHANPPVPTQAPAIDLYALYEDVNADRTASGLQPLRLDQRLVDSATAKCKDMQTKDYWAHDAPDGTSWASFIQATAGTKAGIGENLAQGFATADGVNTGWMHSQDHRDNILRPLYNSVGYARCDVPGFQTVIVQHFARL